jgi:hypothetical protein
MGPFVSLHVLSAGAAPSFLHNDLRRKMKTTLFALSILLAAALASEPPPLLGASETQLTERYGTPLYAKKDDGPFKRMVTYRVDDVTITVSLVGARVEILDFFCEQGINGVRVKQILARCGGEWEASGNRWTRKDGSSAEFSDAHFIVTSAAAVRAREDHDKEKGKLIRGL